MSAPNPGTPEARDAGCICPVIDNGHGRGSGHVGEGGEPLFWYRGDCPIHAEEYRHVETERLISAEEDLREDWDSRRYRKG